MKQYIDKDRILAEIERRKNQFVSQAESFHKIGMEDKESYYAALASNMNSLSCFLNTLEVKEDVVSNDPLANSLEISRHGNSHNGGNGNLEEAASQYPSVICHISPQWKSEVENVFKAGAEWQKEQIINKAWDWIEDNILSSNQQDKSLLYYEQFKKNLEK